MFGSLKHISELMQEDLLASMDGQPFSIDSDRKLHFEPGDSLGTSLTIQFRAIFEGSKSSDFALQVLLKDENDRPITMQNMSLNALTVTGEIIEGRVSPKGELVIPGLETDTNYRFSFDAAVTAKLLDRPLHLEGRDAVTF